MDPWVLAILLLLLGMSLAVLEIFFPSGGILSVLTVSALIAAMVLGFRSGMGMGLIISAGTVIGMPIVVVLALKYWPQTPIGRRIILTNPSVDAPQEGGQNERTELIGKIGKTKTPMLLAGAVAIDGEVLNAVSEGPAIEPGQWVIVTDVSGNRIKVRPHSPKEGVKKGGTTGPPTPLTDVVEDPFDGSSA